MSTKSYSSQSTSDTSGLAAGGGLHGGFTITQQAGVGGSGVEGGTAAAGASSSMSSTSYSSQSTSDTSGGLGAFGGLHGGLGLTPGGGFLITQQAGGGAGGAAGGVASAGGSSSTSYSSQSTSDSSGLAAGGGNLSSFSSQSTSGAPGGFALQVASGGGGEGGGAMTQRFSTVGPVATSNWATSESTNFSTTTQQTLSPGALQGGMTAAQYAQLQVEMAQKRIFDQMQQQQGGALAGSAGSMSVVPGDASFQTYSIETPGGGSASYASSSSTDTKEIPGGTSSTSMQKSSYSSFSSS